MEPEMSQRHKFKSMDPGKFSLLKKLLEGQDRDTRSMTTEVSDSGLATHTAASELGTEEINGKLAMLFYSTLTGTPGLFICNVKFSNRPVSRTTMS